MCSENKQTSSLQPPLEIGFNREQNARARRHRRQQLRLKQSRAKHSKLTHYEHMSDCPTRVQRLFNCVFCMHSFIIVRVELTSSVARRRCRAQCCDSVGKIRTCAHIYTHTHFLFIIHSARVCCVRNLSRCHHRRRPNMRSRAHSGVLEGQKHEHVWLVCSNI